MADTKIKTENLDAVISITKVGSTMVAECSPMPISEYKLSPIPNGDYEVTLKYIVKSPNVVTHVIAAKKEDQMP